MTVRFRALALAVAVCGAVAAGCGPQPLPAGVTAFCPSTSTIAMVYPAPGSTAIPDNLSGIVLATVGTLAGTSNTLVAPLGATSPITFSNISAAPSPIPSPNAAPTFSNPQYSFSAATQALPAATQISAFFNDTSGICSTVFLGTFTTK